MFRLPKFGDSVPTPAYAEYEMDEAISLDEEVSNGGHPGFAGFHLLRDPESGARNSLYCYWDDMDSLRVGRGHLEHKFGLPTPTRVGYVAKYSSTPRFFEKISLKATILTIAAILGALELIGSHYDWLFEKPQIWPRLENEDPVLRYVSGEEVKEQLLLSTSSPVPNRQIRVEYGRLVPKVTHDTITLRANESEKGLASKPIEVARLERGETKKLSLRGETSEPGEYSLNLRVSSRSGLLRSRRNFDVSRTVEVWPRAPELRLELFKVLRKEVHLKGTFRLAQSALSGLECQTVLAPAPETETKLVLFTVPDKLAVEDLQRDVAGENVYSIFWETGKITDRFSKLPIVIVLESGSPEKWQMLAPKMDTTCSKKKNPRGEIQ